MVHDLVTVDKNINKCFKTQNQKISVHHRKKLEPDTGRQLAASDYFSPMSAGFQVWAGYGGIIYEGLNDGNIMALKVLPATNATSTANMTVTAAGQNSTLDAS